MDGKKGLLIGATVLVVILGLAMYRMQQAQPGAGAPGGNLVPDIETRTIDGQTWRLRDQRGKVLMLDFWATWCPPCVASIPHLKQIYNRFKSEPDFLMVGVSGDGDPDLVANFVKQHEIPWLQLVDPRDPLAQAFGIQAIPSVWVIDREGRVAGSHLEGAQIEATIAATLARK
jgi:peroxiredoxin